MKLRAHWTADQAIQHIRDIGLDKETIYNSYVIDEKGFLIGIVSLKDLFLAPSKTVISDIMTTNFVSVQTTQEQEEAAGVLADYDLNSIPVVDLGGK